MLMPASPSDMYTTKELSGETWPDFERLFRKQGFVGDGWWCWCTFHHVSSFSSKNQQPRTRAERANLNHEKKKKLVLNGCAHGILVYKAGEPVGWCQYGLREELPRIDNTVRYRKLALQSGSEKLWRITCFVVDREHRRCGVASIGLKAALESIKKNGGGMVEAYPVSETDQGANSHYCGTVSMFEKTGFGSVAPFAQGRTSTVVMRKTL